jgi:hypothetical protein
MRPAVLAPIAAALVPAGVSAEGPAARSNVFDVHAVELVLKKEPDRRKPFDGAGSWSRLPICPTNPQPNHSPTTTHHQ